MELHPTTGMKVNQTQRT